MVRSYLPNMSDKPNTPRPMAIPTGRIARLGRLGTMAAGVAGNMAMGSLAQLARRQRPSLPNLLLNPKNITRVTD